MLNVPLSMRHPLFFNDRREIEKTSTIPFLEELLYFNGFDGVFSPFEKKKESVQSKFEGWKNSKEQIKAHFAERKRAKAKEPMIYQISCFLQALFWCNAAMADNLLSWQEKTKNLSVSPANATERLSFIMQQPDHYQSYIQLNQLFLELEKAAAVSLR